MPDLPTTAAHSPHGSGGLSTAGSIASAAPPAATPAAEEKGIPSNTNDAGPAPSSFTVEYPVTVMLWSAQAQAQEIGRAGRGRTPAWCILLCSSRDLTAKGKNFLAARKTTRGSLSKWFPDKGRLSVRVTTTGDWLLLLAASLLGAMRQSFRAAAQTMPHLVPSVALLDGCSTGRICNAFCHTVSAWARLRARTSMRAAAAANSGRRCLGGLSGARAASGWGGTYTPHTHHLHATYRHATYRPTLPTRQVTLFLGIKRRIEEVPRRICPRLGSTARRLALTLCVSAVCPHEVRHVLLSLSIEL